jgi:hypothetical protein
MEIKGLWSFIAFIPHFLLIISAFILFPSEKNRFKIIRTEAIIDLILRIAAFFINFRIRGLEKFSMWFDFVIMSVVVLFLLNILLESIMYKKVSSYNESNDIEYYEFSFEDRNNYNDMRKAVLNETIEIPIIIIIITTILGFKRSSSTGSIIDLSVLDVLLLIYFFKHSYESLSLFYKDKLIVRKIFIKENKFVVINILVGVILVALRVLVCDFCDLVNFVLFSLQMSILIPNFIARNKRSIKVNKIRRAKEELI